MATPVTSGFAVRDATRADVDLLMDLCCRTFEDAFGADNDPADMAAYVTAAFSRSQILTEVLTPESIFLLAYDEALNSRQPLGYARLLGGSPDATVTGPQPLELCRLYLESWAIGRGYGRLLMQACLERAATEGYQTLWLGVWEHNARARKFYDRWGFQRVGSHGFQLGQDLQTDFILARPVGAPVDQPS
jgi:ribosomal protein S18 acetylase RimI-like enzyme